MRKPRAFVGVAESRLYTAGCTGQTVYVFDREQNEVARFKDLKYAYECLFSPDEKTLVVQSTSGQIAVYSMETMTLLHKLRYGRDGGQDSGFCFSATGKTFYILELVAQDRHLYQRLVSYDTADYAKKTVEWEEKDVMLVDVAPGDREGVLYLTGYMRDPRGYAATLFAVKRIDGEIVAIRYPDNLYEFECYSKKKIDYRKTVAIFEELPPYEDDLENGVAFMERCRLYSCLIAVNDCLYQTRQMLLPPRTRVENIDKDIYQKEQRAILADLYRFLAYTDRRYQTVGLEGPFSAITLDNLRESLDTVEAICLACLPVRQFKAYRRRMSQWKPPSAR